MTYRIFHIFSLSRIFLTFEVCPLEKHETQELSFLGLNARCGGNFSSQLSHIFGSFDSMVLLFLRAQRILTLKRFTLDVNYNPFFVSYFRIRYLLRMIIFAEQ